MKAKRVFINGNLITLEDDLPPVQALAAYDGRIVAVGSNEHIQSLAGERTDTIDLQGKALLPGFIDAHTHLLHTGMERTLYADLDTPSLDELLQVVEAQAKTREPGQWVVGRGWDESNWPQSDYPTKVDLDRVAPDHPLVLIRVCGHIVVVNSKALELVPVKDAAHTVDRNQGWLREESAWNFLDHIEPDLEERLKALKAGIQHAHRCGITSIHDIADGASVQTYMALKRAGELSLRVRLNLEHPLLEPLMQAGLQGEFGDDFLQLGALKLFADGSLGARNAALLEPYADAPDNNGVLNHVQSTLENWLSKGHKAGFQLMTHAIGDRAIEAVLDAYEAIGISTEDRARIEHLEMPNDAQLARMHARGVIASMQPNFLQWSGPQKLYVQRLGPDRDARIDPHHRVLAHGVPLAFSSDSMPLNPLYGLHLAVNAPHEGQRLSVLEALRAYTLGGAYAGKSEQRLGSLKVGKQADLVVLDENPLEAGGRLDQLRVMQVYVAGRPVLPS